MSNARAFMGGGMYQQQMPSYDQNAGRFNGPAMTYANYSAPKWDASGTREVAQNAVDNYVPYFGPPTRRMNQDDPTLENDAENYDLPEAYKGKITYLSYILKRDIMDTEAYPVTEMAPWRNHESSRIIQWDVWKFNNTLMGRTPYEGTSRLLTSTKATNKASTVRFGLAFLLEHGFFKTKEGRLRYGINRDQIRMAVHETACFGAITEILNHAPYEDEWTKHAQDRNYNDMETRIKQEIDDWAKPQKVENGWELMYNDLKQVLRERTGEAGNLTVIPAGLRSFVGQRPEHTNAMISGKTGGIDYNAMQADGSVLRDSRGYRIGPNEPNRDPCFREQTIGGYFQCLHHHVKDIPVEHFQTRMLDTCIYSENPDKFIRLSYAEMLLKYSGLYYSAENADPNEGQSPLQISPIGRMFFNTPFFKANVSGDKHMYWGNVLRKTGVMDRAVDAFMRKSPDDIEDFYNKVLLHLNTPTFPKLALSLSKAPVSGADQGGNGASVAPIAPRQSPAEKYVEDILSYTNRTSSFATRFSPIIAAAVTVINGQMIKENKPILDVNNRQIGAAEVALNTSIISQLKDAELIDQISCIIPSMRTDVEKLQFAHKTDIEINAAEAASNLFIPGGNNITTVNGRWAPLVSTHQGVGSSIQLNSLGEALTLCHNNVVLFSELQTTYSNNQGIEQFVFDPFSGPSTDILQIQGLVNRSNLYWKQRQAHFAVSILASCVYTAYMSSKNPQLAVRECPRAIYNGLLDLRNSTDPATGVTTVVKWTRDVDNEALKRALDQLILRPCTLISQMPVYNAQIKALLNIIKLAFTTDIDNFLAQTAGFFRTLDTVNTNLGTFGHWALEARKTAETVFASVDQSMSDGERKSDSVQPSQDLIQKTRRALQKPIVGTFGKDAQYLKPETPKITGDEFASKLAALSMVYDQPGGANREYALPLFNPQTLSGVMLPRNNTILTAFVIFLQNLLLDQQNRYSEDVSMLIDIALTPTGFLNEINKPYICERLVQLRGIHALALQAGVNSQSIEAALLLCKREDLKIYAALTYAEIIDKLRDNIVVEEPINSPSKSLAVLANCNTPAMFAIVNTWSNIYRKCCKVNWDTVISNMGSGLDSIMLRLYGSAADIYDDYDPNSRPALDIQSRLATAIGARTDAGGPLHKMQDPVSGEYYHRLMGRVGWRTLLDTIIRVDNGHFFKWCLDNNVPIGLGFMGNRSSMRYEMGTTIHMKGWGAAANTFAGHADMMMGDNPTIKMHYGHFTMEAKTIVLHPINIVLARNSYCRAYLGGNNHLIWDPLNPNDIVDYKNNELLKDIHICAVPGNMAAPDWHIDITGRPPKGQEAPGRDVAKLDYMSALIYSAVWGWRQKSGPIDTRSGNDLVTMFYNTMVIQDHQFYYEWKGEGQGTFSGIHINRGHWGERVYETCAAARIGKRRCLEPIKWTKTNTIGFAV